jgi:hypothetical protein
MWSGWLPCALSQSPLGLDELASTHNGARFSLRMADMLKQRQQPRSYVAPIKASEIFALN